MRNINTIIVDDEELARYELHYMLKSYPEINVVGEADTVDSTIQLIKEKKPDLIFLDIQLGNETGFELFNKLDIKACVVFVTAYDEYAIRAFDVNALDYLLKPVNSKRLKETIKRYCESNFNNKNIGSFDYNDRIFIKTNHTLKFVELSSMLCICANGDYSIIHKIDGQDIITLKTLKSWASILPESHFVRIHRSIIINKTYIENIDHQLNNSYQIRLKNFSNPLPISKRYAVQLKKSFNF